MKELPPIEKLIFVVTALVSFALFLRELWPVAQSILKSKADAGFQWGDWKRRVWAFIWEVLLQGKVIQERPLPGLAHAVVFWGFCAFALVTVDHLAAGLGWPVLSKDSAFGRLYFAVVAGFAVAVSIAIAGLTFRRFVLRPRWLGKLSLHSAVIAALILTLMLTYLAGLRLEEGTRAARWNWWAHTLALAVFLPIIPRTKHLHLMLSPLAVFLRRHSFSRIPPLEGEEDFGLETGKDLSWLMALQSFSCVECGRCTEHCPANNTGKELDPKEVILGVRRYLREQGPQSGEPIAGRYVSEKALFQCTTCGACEYQCPVGIQHLAIIIGLRRALVNTGRWEDDYGSKLFLNLERTGNSLGMPAVERTRFVEREGLPLFDGSQEYCLWLGCMGAYDPQGREIVAALARVLRYLGVSFGVLGRERCTGDPARRLGNDYLVSQLAEANGAELKARRVLRVISICPHCVRTMTEDWKEWGVAVIAEHHSEFLARHAGRLPVRTNGGRTVVHDPCYLGRYRDQYDAPRVAVERTSRLVEAQRSRGRSFCCGAGGGQAFLGEEEGKRVSVERAEELAATGADTVATACPFCATMLRDALQQVSANGPRLMDIVQMTAASLEANK